MVPSALEQSLPPQLKKNILPILCTYWLFLQFLKKITFFKSLQWNSSYPPLPFEGKQVLKVVQVNPNASTGCVLFCPIPPLSLMTYFEGLKTGGNTRRELAFTQGCSITFCNDSRSAGLWRRSLEIKSRAPSVTNGGNFKSTCGEGSQTTAKTGRQACHLPLCLPYVKAGLQDPNPAWCLLLSYA